MMILMKRLGDGLPHQNLKSTPPMEMEKLDFLAM
jgi:hypothetical protein